MKIKTKILGYAAVVAVAAGLWASTAAADTVSGSGVWVSNLSTIDSSATAVTPYSVSGETFSFSFQLPHSFSYVTMNGGFTIPTTVVGSELTDFSYSLNGSVITRATSPTLVNCTTTLVLCGVEFFPASSGGGIGLDFGDYTVELIGPDIGSNGTLVIGNYDTFIPNIDYTFGGDNMVINEGSGPTTVSVVPEPMSWAFMMLGVAGIGGTLRDRRRASAAA